MPKALRSVNAPRAHSEKAKGGCTRSGTIVRARYSSRIQQADICMRTRVLKKHSELTPRALEERATKKYFQMSKLHRFADMIRPFFAQESPWNLKKCPCLQTGLTRVSSINSPFSMRRGKSTPWGVSLQT